MRRTILLTTVDGRAQFSKAALGCLCGLALRTFPPQPPPKFPPQYRIRHAFEIHSRDPAFVQLIEQLFPRHRSKVDALWFLAPG